MAYMRIGDVQGGVLESNLGDVKGALESYRKARELFEKDTGSDRARQVSNVDVKIGDALSYHADLPSALAAYARAQSIMEPVATQAGASAEDVEQLANVFHSVARVQGLLRDNARSLESTQRVLALRRSLLERDPTRQAWIDSLAGTEAEVSMALQRLGDAQGALPHARESLAMRERLAAEQPNNAGAQRKLILSYSHVADVLGNPTMPSLGDSAGAVEIYRKMIAVAERLVAADASDRRAKWDLANCLLRLGSALVAATAREEGIDRLKESAALMREIAAAEPANNRVRVSQAFVFRRIGDALVDGGRPDEAINHFKNAIAVSEAVLAADPAEGTIVSILATSHSGRGLALARVGQHDAALSDGRRGVEVAEKARTAQPGNTRTLAGVAAAYAAMGRIHHARRGVDSLPQGCAWFDKSLQAYGQANKTSALDAQTAADLDAVTRDSARCR
jgi:tetratricopeptide (TPR) repeat protein